MKRFISMLVIMALLITSMPIYAETTFHLDENSSGDNEIISSTVFFDNKGHKDKDVDFYADIYGGSIFYNKKGQINYVLPLGQEELTYWSFNESFIGGEPKLKGDKETKEIYNLLLGDTKAKSVKGYQALNLGEVYENIEVRDVATVDSVERYYTVKPGGNHEDILVLVEGVDQLIINDEGELIWMTEIGSLKLSAPYAYQVIEGQEVEVQVTYKVIENQYGFELGDYHPDYDLIIDPTVICSNFGNANDVYAKDIHTDNQGNVIIVGYTTNSNYEPNTGPVVSFTGNKDMFISKYDKNFQNILVTTFLGGTESGEDTALALDIDSNNNIYVAGITDATNFPSAGTPYDSSVSGSSGIIAKFDSNLNLTHTTVIDYADAVDITLDENGDVLVVGTAKLGYTTTPGAYQTSVSNDSAYVARYSNDLSTLMASTVLDGYLQDYGKSIKLSRSGEILVSGATFSSDFPVTSGAYNTTSNGSWDVFAAILSRDMTSLNASTYVGLQR